MIRRAAVAALAGVAGAIAFSPSMSPWILPPAVACFFLCVRGLRLRRAALVGWAFGIGFQFTLLWWMRAVGVDAWAALSAIESAFYAALGAASVVLMRHRLWPLLVAAAWLATDVARSSWPFSGMPWGRLGFATIDTPLAAATAYVGITGVTFLVALLGAVGAWTVATLTARWRGTVGPLRFRPLLGAWVGLLAVCAAPALVPWQSAPEGQVRVAVVQGNVPGRGTDVLLDVPQLTRNHRDATLAYAGQLTAGERARPDFVVWPENSTAIDPFDNPDINSDITQAVAAVDAPILVGAMVNAPDPTQVMNQGIVWSPDAGAGDRYTKRHPVPFGEYIPWRDSVFSGTFGKLRLIPRDMVSGTRTAPLTIAGIPVADSICFDVGYDDGIRAQLTSGAAVMVVQTSNAMFVYTDQIDQQFAITRLRAVESHRAIAVAATNGLTGLIGPDGRVLAVADRRTQTVLDAALPLETGITPGTRWGIWVGRVALWLVGAVLGLEALAYRRRRRAGRSVDTGATAAPSPLQTTGTGSQPVS